MIHADGETDEDAPLSHYSFILLNTYNIRDQTVRFAYVVSLWVKEKQKHLLRKPKALSSHERRQRAKAYCRWEIFTVATVHASRSAAMSASFISLQLTSVCLQTHRLAPTSVQKSHEI
jgi:hypothetical protein